ncbi:dolichyl-P-Man:Man(7)GlcNAc(2)-PP-dolichol alpha-1,6-mannosyltransferase [Rhizoclosmatium sp. JEL0117]|nr:dolichyl-P-Man:Man(7)GlcNAc(2)-PP-dolichol alpha-1,6-mannosyltransferase [Rhizoclosmatium sp. JEL0117]
MEPKEAKEPSKEKEEIKTEKDEKPPASLVSIYSNAALLTDDPQNINNLDFIAIIPGFVYDALVLGFMVYAVFAAPFTKVEESFNIQAIHDLMLMPVSRLDQFDHMSFPGVVPRTFIGPLFIKLVTHPVISFMTSDGTTVLQTDSYLYIARIALAILTVHSLRMIRMSAARVFGHTVSAFFGIVCLTQFHLIFWGSRYIPNTFAMILVNYGVASWIYSWKPITYAEVVEQSKERDRIFGSPPLSLNDGNRKRNRKKVKEDPAAVAKQLNCIGLISFILFAAIVFRLELLALLGTILLSEIFIYKHIQLLPAILTCLFVGITSLPLTLAIDTFFWKSSPTPMWPEYQVFLFNILQGRSKEYGTSPPHTYITSLLPRIATLAYPLAIYAYTQDHRVRRLLSPAVVFTTVMSCIGHKEWRFLFPILPLINLASALALTRIHRLGTLTARTRPQNTTGSAGGLHRVLAGVVVPVAVLASLVFVNVAVDVSARNYPGGVAMRAVYQYVSPSEGSGVLPYVHMDVYTCQTGASRFMELGAREGWVYSKEEGLVEDRQFVERGFTHLLTSTPELHLGEGPWEDGDDGEDNGREWFKVPGYIHGLKGVKVEFGPGGWKAWVAESIDKVLKGKIAWRPNEFVYGVKLPIEVYMEPKIYLLQSKTWQQ